MRSDMHGNRPSWWELIILAVALIVTLFPLFWMVMTSFKPQSEWITSPPVWIPSRPTLNNYLTVLNPGALAAQGQVVGAVTESATRAVLGSLLTASVSTLIAVTFGTLAALAISRFRTGGNVTPFFILSARMFPPIAAAIPIVIMFSNLKLIDTYPGLIVAYAAFTVPFATWMVKSFIDDAPRELEEAAVIDGLTTLKAHLTVTLPLVKGGIAATILFVFILNWSEFLFALVLSYTHVITIPVQLSKYHTATSGTLYGPQAAMGLLAVIPLVIVGMAIQRYLARGLTFGAIKR